MKYLFNLFRQYRVLQSLRITRKADNQSKNRLPVKISRKAKVVINSEARIYLGPKAHFVFGENSGDNFGRVSYLKLGSGAALEVNGVFTIYDNARVYVRNNAKLVLGDGYISADSMIVCTEKIEIGQGAYISDGVVIRDSDDHEIIREGYRKTSPIHIGDRVWIGHGAVILKGVTIGDGAIIGAGAIVTKNVPAGCVVAGNPACVIHQQVEWR